MPLDLAILVENVSVDLTVYRHARVQTRTVSQCRHKIQRTDNIVDVGSLYIQAKPKGLFTARKLN